MANEENLENKEENVVNDSEKEEKKVILNAEEDGIVTENSSQSETKKENKTSSTGKRKFGSILGFDEIANLFKRTREQNKNVKKYAIIGIIFSICSIALVYPCFYGGLGLFNFLINTFFASLSTALSGNIVLIILLGFLIAVILGTLAIALFLLPVALALFSLVLPIFQLIVNKKWWGWVALVFGVSAIPLCIFLLSTLIQAL